MNRVFFIDERKMHNEGMESLGLNKQKTKLGFGKALAPEANLQTGEAFTACLLHYS